MKVKKEGGGKKGRRKKEMRKKEMRKKEASQRIKPRTLILHGRPKHRRSVVKALTVSYRHRLGRHLQ